MSVLVVVAVAATERECEMGAWETSVDVDGVGVRLRNVNVDGVGVHFCTVDIDGVGVGCTDVAFPPVPLQLVL